MKRRLCILEDHKSQKVGERGERALIWIGGNREERARKEEEDVGKEGCFELLEGPLLEDEEKKECRCEEGNRKGTERKTKRKMIVRRMRTGKRKEESVKE